MARIAAQTPYGVAVEQDDGSMSWMPPGYDPGAAAAAPLPPPATTAGGDPYGVTVLQPDGNALFLPPGFGPESEAASLRDQQSGSPVPDLARDAVAADINAGAIPLPSAPGAAPTAGEIDMEAEDIGGTAPGSIDPTTGRLLSATGLAPPSAGIADPFANDVDAISGADAATAPPPAPPTPGMPDGPEPPPRSYPPLSPLEQQEMAVETAAALAAKTHTEEAAKLAERDQALTVKPMKEDA